MYLHKVGKINIIKRHIKRQRLIPLDLNELRSDGITQSKVDRRTAAVNADLIRKLT